MNKYIKKLENVCVLGATGNMGKGILLSLATTLTNYSLENIDSPVFKIYAIGNTDIKVKKLRLLMESNIRRVAEKKIVYLRKLFSSRDSLIENSEIINAYIDEVLSIITFSTQIELAYEADVIFESIKEDLELKSSTLQKIFKNSKNTPWILSNTSSIPIRKIDSMAGLCGNIIGFHFFNPPELQKLVEIVRITENSELFEFSTYLSKLLKKEAVFCKDIPGFIGNNYFGRELFYALNKAKELGEIYGRAFSIFTINEISKKYLVRPIGVFQLVDYVGLDVCRQILINIGSSLKEDHINANMFDEVMPKNFSGGQNIEGAQEQGLFKYVNKQITHVWDSKENSYIDISVIQRMYGEIVENELPVRVPTWKQLSFSTKQDKNNQLTDYFEALKQKESYWAGFIQDYCMNTRIIGGILLNNGVCENKREIEQILFHGFQHIYSPFNSYI